MTSTIRAPHAIACALAALAWTTVAAPQAPVLDKEACASAHEQAQVFRKHGRLVEARDKLRLCSNDACPALARQDCGVWIVEVEDRLPTIVVSAKNGAPLTDVKCTLDGAPFIEKIDATPIAINPGAHALRCVHDGVVAEQSLAVVEGEKGRRVDVVFEAPAPPPSASASSPPAPSATASAAPSATFVPPPPRETPVTAYAFAGAAALGFASFAYFGLTGLSDENNLRSTCKTSCNPNDVNAVSTKYHVADASLAFGVVAASVAAWIYFSRPAPGAPQNGARLGVTAMPGGGGARVEVRF